MSFQSSAERRSENKHSKIFRGFLGIDDTDMPGISGTGLVSRILAQELQNKGINVYGITRHQLYCHPSIRCTRLNSCKVIWLHAKKDQWRPVWKIARATVKRLSISGSDPGIALLFRPTDLTTKFGQKLQQEIASKEEAYMVAKDSSSWIEELGGDGSGVIGALGGCCLAAEGNDGWFLDIGGIRNLKGVVSFRQLRDAGITQAREIHPPYTLVDLDGHGWLNTGDWVRPIVASNRPLLLVERNSDGTYTAASKAYIREVTGCTGNA
ncbi:MAG: hypothetical protein ACTSW4_06295 [Candidatus Ranarchaeia archaeon]